MTDGFHFPDDVLHSLYSFPPELVSKLRRPKTQCSSMPEPPTELNHVNRHSVDEVEEDLLPNKECDMIANDTFSTHDVPMEDCSVTMNLASNSETVDTLDSSTVVLIRCPNTFVKNDISFSVV